MAAEWEAASAANAPGLRDHAIHDAVLALISLGYKQVDAHKAVKQVLDKTPAAAGDAEELIRQSLRYLI